MLKQLLPTLRPAIHDPSARVRRAFLDLLATVKSMRDVCYYDIVPNAHLLARLPAETDSNRLKVRGLWPLFGRCMQGVSKQPQGPLSHV